MEGTETKYVAFNGCVLTPTRRADNSIWVSAKSVLQCIGVTGIKLRREQDKLSENIDFTDDLYRESNELYIRVDSLKKWLEKIRFSGTSKRNNPILYQRYCNANLNIEKDIMAAFSDSVDISRYDAEFRNLNDRIDSICNGMGKLTQVILNYVEGSKEAPKKRKRRTTEKHLVDIIKFADFEQWKYEAGENVKQLLGTEKWSSQKAVLEDVYKYLTNNYGIVWEQEIKDTMENNRLASRPSMLEVIYLNPTIRSIFDSRLKDMVEQNKNTSDKSLDEIIMPLIQKFNDNTNHGIITFKRVYSKMSSLYGINWAEEKGKYEEKYKTTPNNKKVLIETSPELREYFISTVNEIEGGINCA